MPKQTKKQKKHHDGCGKNCTWIYAGKVQTDNPGTYSFEICEHGNIRLNSPSGRILTIQEFIRQQTSPKKIPKHPLFMIYPEAMQIISKHIG